MSTTTQPKLRLDPITFEVIRSSLMTMVDEMGHRLFRAALSPPVNQGRDYSIAVFDSEGSCVTAGHWDMPVHYGTFPYTIREVMRVMGRENLKQGDIYLFNDPYTGGTHNPDIRAVRPIFREGELVAWVVSMAHWPDVGGPVPGSFNSEAADCYSEGVRIPPIKVYENDEPLDWVIQLLLTNMRNGHERNGDLYAQIQTLFMGEERLLELFDKYGADTMSAAFEESWDYAERMLRAQTEQVPDGVYEYSSFIDQDALDPELRPVEIKLKMTVESGNLTFDFTDSDDAPLGPVGSTLPTTLAGVLLTVLNLFPGVPYNDGIQRVVRLKTRPGSAVHVLPPSPCSGTACGSLEKVIDCVIGAVGAASPDREMGGRFNLVNLTMGGRDERTGQDYVMYMWTTGGMGGSARGDLPYPTHTIFGPGIRTQPTEVLERHYPVLITKAAVRESSFGAGEHRGGWGTQYRFKLTSGSAKIGIMGDRRKFVPWGVQGGADAPPQSVIRDPGLPEEYDVGMSASNVPISAGSDFELLTTGGGGWGDALKRDPKLVLEDVIDEYISVDEAKEQYGVVIDPVDPYLLDYRLDDAATACERQARAAA